MGLNPGSCKLCFFLLAFSSFSLPTVCTLLQCLLLHDPAHVELVTWEEKREESQKNPSSTIHEANADIRVMFGKTGVGGFNKKSQLKPV